MSRYAMCPDCGHRMRRVLDFGATGTGNRMSAITALRNTTMRRKTAKAWTYTMPR